MIILRGLSFCLDNFQHKVVATVKDYCESVCSVFCADILWMEYEVVGMDLIIMVDKHSPHSIIN